MYVCLQCIHALQTNKRLFIMHTCIANKQQKTLFCSPLPLIHTCPWARHAFRGRQHCTGGQLARNYTSFWALPQRLVYVTASHNRLTCTDECRGPAWHGLPPAAWRWSCDLWAKRTKTCTCMYVHCTCTCIYMLHVPDRALTDHPSNHRYSWES